MTRSLSIPSPNCFQRGRRPRPRRLGDVGHPVLDGGRAAPDNGESAEAQTAAAFHFGQGLPVTRQRAPLLGANSNLRHLTNQAITLSSVRSPASYARGRRPGFVPTCKNKGI